MDPEVRETSYCDVDDDFHYRPEKECTKCVAKIVFCQVYGASNGRDGTVVFHNNGRIHDISQEAYNKDVNSKESNGHCRYDNVVRLLIMLHFQQHRQ